MNDPKRGPISTNGEANTDQTKVHQIVINLLSNAIKFTETGEVTVSVSKDGPADDVSLVIAVSDTGSGIPADAVDTLIEEFQQVKGSDRRIKVQDSDCRSRRGLLSCWSGPSACRVRRVRGLCLW